MGVIDTIRAAVSEDSTVIHECRDCGEKIGTGVDECPSCESDEIARYQF